MNLFTSDFLGNAQNCRYRTRVSVANVEELKNAVSHDYVCAAYRNGFRSTENFLWSDCLAFDCDNTHSEEEGEWITPERIRTMFPGVKFAVHYSRNSGKRKGSRSPRPRFHVFFPVEKIGSAEEYTAWKKRVLAEFPYFDRSAADAARFFFGTEEPEAEFFEGDISVTEFYGRADKFLSLPENDGIEEGSRNSRMSAFAAKVLKRYGDTEDARRIFLEHNAKCSPPLGREELDGIWKSARKFYARVRAQEGYIPPEKYAVRSLKPEDYFDIGQGKVLAREYRDVLCYTDAMNFLCYDGVRWRPSMQLAVGLVQDFSDLQAADAEDAVAKATEALRKAGVSEAALGNGGKSLEKSIEEGGLGALYAEYRDALAYRNFALKRRDMKYVLSALAAVKPRLLKEITEFDSQEYLLNTPKATYDLRLGLKGAREHDPEDRITMVTAVSPDRENEGLWRKAVSDFFLGDEELMEYVQEIVGLCAIGKVYMEALIIAYGDGSNGKSTFWNSIAAVLGSYSGMISAEALTVGGKRNFKPELAELKGKRLVIAAELEEGVRLSTSMVKQLCSTDEIEAEKKYEAPFKYRPTHTLVLYTNHLPRVGANDSGIWRRQIVIPFGAKIEGRQDIKNYADYLVANAGGAILSWIIEGAEKAIACGYKITKPASVVEAIGKYREGNDWLGAFLEDCCDTGQGYIQKSGELYQEYRNYCQRMGEFARSTTDFYTNLENAGFGWKRMPGGRFVTGLKLKEDLLLE